MARVMIELDLDQPVQRQMYDNWHLLVTSTVPHALIERLRQTQTFRDFLRPLAQAITPDEFYNASGIGQLFDPPKTPRQVAAALAKIGKPEKRLGQKVIQRQQGAGQQRYGMTADVRELLLAN